MRSSKYFAGNNVTANAELIEGRLRITWTQAPTDELRASADYQEWLDGLVERAAAETGQTVEIVET